MKMYLKKLFQNLKLKANTNKHQNEGKEKEEGDLGKKERDLEKRMNCINRTLVSRYQEIVEATQKKHFKAKIIIHQNTAPIYKKLSEEGVKIYYCPKKLEIICGAINESDYSFLILPNEKKDLVAEFRNIVMNNLLKYFNSTLRKSYFIPPESINTVFGMIEQKEKPAKIVEYLKRKST